MISASNTFRRAALATTAIVGLLSLPLVSLAVVGAVTGSTQASELKYRPVNPSFGGDPFNSSHLLGIAGAVNKFEEPKKDSLTSALSNPQDEFSRVIKSSILSRVASNIADQIYGESGTRRESGSVVIDNTTINWRTVNGQIELRLQDGTQATVISIPSF